MKKTRYIIPFKYNGDIRRLFNLETVKKHVKKNLPQIDLFVIEQGTVQVDKSSFFIFNDKKFNKSWALNFAVKKAIEDGRNYADEIAKKTRDEVFDIIGLGIKKN